MRVFLAIGFVAFVFYYFGGCSFYESPYYEKVADEITRKTAKKLFVEKNLRLSMTGGGMMGCIWKMSMNFHYYQELDIKKGRELIIEVVHEYLSAINGKKEIRPYLYNYPFTMNNIEITIFIHNTDGSNIAPEKISCIDCMNGRIGYYLRSNYYKGIHEETYEEALVVLESEASK